MMRPIYTIEADGNDITPLVQGRLISLLIVDKSGNEADTAELEIDDIDYHIALPNPGAKLKIALGFAPAPVNMGLYTVDLVSGSGPRAALKIKAKAADMTGAMRAPKSRSWSKPSMGQIVSEIAADHGLEPMIDKAIASAKFAYVAQTSESDLNLLTRLARDLDAIVIPGATAGGEIILTGIKPELCGPWIATSVTHRLGGPLHTSITAERDNDKEASS